MPRLARAATLVLLALAVLVPPWREVERFRGDFQRAQYRQFSPVFWPPDSRPNSYGTAYTIEIDTGRAILTIGGAAVLAAVTFALTRRHRTNP